MQANGIITHYTIYYRQIFGNQSVDDIVNSFRVDGEKTSTIIDFSGTGLYRVWLVATNGAGSSPKSKPVVVATDEHWAARKLVLKST